MPVLMFKVSTAKSGHRRDAKQWEEELRKGVERAGGQLVCLHSGGGGVAYGVVEDPGGHDYDTLVAVLSVIAEIAGEVISWVTGD